MWMQRCVPGHQTSPTLHGSRSVSPVAVLSEHGLGRVFFARLFRAGSVPQLRPLHSPMAARRGIWGLWGC